RSLERRRCSLVAGGSAPDHECHSGLAPGAAHRQVRLIGVINQRVVAGGRELVAERGGRDEEAWAGTLSRGGA
ncbi:MAG: hypothetical protein AVDCRST_MAG93-6113, partial [uncultured Chloroflexia bacterium]